MVASHVARGRQRGHQLRSSIGDEIRRARIASGLRQTDLAVSLGISDSEVSRIECGGASWLSVDVAAQLCSVTGLELWLRAYPAGDPLRDAAHVRLLEALRRIIGPGLSLRAEVPIGPPRDLRAWDATIGSGRAWVHAELESRLTDAQALVRRLTLKLRDASAPRIQGLVLVLADTRTNRGAALAARSTLASIAPASPSEILEGLRAGRLPDRGGVIFLRPARTSG